MAHRFFEGAAHAAVYAKFRPYPPTSLTERIITFLKEKYTDELTGAGDVGCGSGQTTQILAPYFTSVTGLDISEAQINEAIEMNKRDSVSFKISGAEKLPFHDASLQLITAGQACHWFDMAKFYEEVDRVLVPGGVVAIYGYYIPEPIHKDCSDKLFGIVDHMYSVDTTEYWGSRRKHVDSGYTDPKFIIPYQGFIRDDSHYLDKMTTVEHFTGYISTWSGFQNYRNDKGDVAASQILQNFQDRIMSTMHATTPPEDTEICLRYRYFLLLGRKPYKQDA